MYTNGLGTEEIKQRDVFVERLLQSTAGLFDVFTVYMGDRLGFYQTMAGADWLTSTELAQRTETNERYAREWIEQQTVSGILEVEDDQQDALARRYRLPDGHAEVLVEQESLNYLAPLAQLAVGAVHPIASVLDAYRQGDGVPFSDYGRDLRDGQASINRAMFLYELGQKYLPAIGDVHARLQADPAARIADIGCGAGWSSIGMVRAYPRVQVDGFDSDEASVELAWANASKYGVSDRVTFHSRDPADASLNGRYDLVTAFQPVLEMSDPVGVLRTMRRLAGDDGAGVHGDAIVVKQVMYGPSALHHLPLGIAAQTSPGAETRAETLLHYALEAGFSDVETLPINDPFIQFYRLHTERSKLGNQSPFP